MSKPYKPLTIPLGRGADQAKVANLPESVPGLTAAENIDFGLRGGLQGRPGMVRVSSFSARQLTTLGVQDVAVATSALTGYLIPKLITVRDGASPERPGIVLRGRLFTYDVNRWTDRLGCTQGTVKRICDLTDVGAPAAPAGTADDMLACGYDMIPGPTPDVVHPPLVSLLSSNGSVEATATVNAVFGVGQGPGSGARNGTTTAYVYVQPASNNLKLVTRANGARVVTEYTLAADAYTPNGAGDQPCICSDYDQTHFFVAFWTNVGAGSFKVIRVTPATGVITHTHTGAIGAGTKLGIWVTNTSLADNKVIFGSATAATNGVQTRVLTASTMATAGFDLVLDGALSMANAGQVVLGVAESNVVTVCYVNTLGDFTIAKRSTTAATLVSSRFWTGKAPNTLTVPGPNREGATFFIQHQPIKLGSRTLIGLSMVRATGASNTRAAATWSVWDITDLWSGLAGTVSYALHDPVAVAKGESYRSVVAWGPAAAILESAGAVTYRFPTADWTALTYATNPATDGSGAATGTGGGTLLGESAVLGLNEVTFAAPQAATYKESTIIAGAVPRMVSRGSTHPLGFPWMEAPSLEVTRAAAAPGTHVVGSYTFQALWTWVDDAGQLHRSEPSFPVTTSVVATTDTMLVAIGVPHFHERETGTVYCELYITDVNPAAGAPRYFRKRYAYPGNGQATVGDLFTSFPIASPRALYSDGGVLEIQTPNADGGICTVGNRCWVSDGKTLFASRLGDSDNNEAPSWHVDGTLSVDVPAQAGLVVGLSQLNDRLIVHCERGIYVTGGEGPDDLGQGPQFLPLTKMSDLGTAGQRAIATTPKGVYFQAANNRADGRLSTGGLWLLDGSGCNQVSRPVQLLTSGVEAGDVTYLPEREQVYWAVANSRLVMFDVRTAQWAVWFSAGGSIGTSQCVAAGILWSQSTDFSSDPVKLTSVDGTDSNGVNPNVDIVMKASLENVNVTAGGLRYGRVRSMSVLGDLGAAYTLNQAVTLIDVGSFSADPMIPTTSSTEWRLPAQKCTAIAITITATPAVAVWTAIELEVYTNGGRRPPAQRQ